MNKLNFILSAALAIAPFQDISAQLWIGGDDFNSSTLDSSKWTGGGSSFVKTTSAVSFFSSVNTGTFGDGIAWSQNLPKNQDWTVTVEASISPLFSTSGSSKFAEALLVVASNDFSSYFTNCLHRDDTFDIVPNWEVNNGGNQELLTTIGLESVLLRMKFDASAQTLTSSHASLTNPTSFTATKTLTTANWGNLNDFVVTIGIYTKDTSISSGRLILDNFSAVPEPSSLSLLVASGAVLMAARRRGK